MAKVRAADSSSTPKKIRPALTPEAEESMMISLAFDQAKKQLMDGTASSQVITHFLKLGSQRERLERERLEEENRLLKAKTKALESAETNDELYKKAIKAMQQYSGNGVSEEYED